MINDGQLSFSVVSSTANLRVYSVPCKARVRILKRDYGEAKLPLLARRRGRL
jgi:hypothetical protein